MSDSNKLISAHNLSLRLNKNTILNHVNLDLFENDFLTIIGPNGAGKTSLLKILLGILPPTEGVITQKPGLKLGYVPQKFTINPAIPVTVGAFLNLKETQKNEKIQTYLDLTGSKTLLSQQMSTLSGGERQKVLLTRALLKHPDCLILDEPAQNMDLSSQLSFYELINQIHTEHQISIIMVSHDLHLVLATSRRVLCLNQTICCSGEPHAISRDAAFEELFGKDMLRIMAIYQHHHQNASKETTHAN
jgi:zinc transport system ATP-binding protein